MAARIPEPERVAERAYSIWEEEGRPHGRDHAHWQRAESELADQPVTAPNGKAAGEPAEPAVKKPLRARKAAAAKAAAGPEAAAPGPAPRARTSAAAPEDPAAAAPRRGRAKGPTAS